MQEDKEKMIRTIPSEVQDTSVLTPGFLVLEGGAQRSVFTMGILDAMMLEGIHVRDVLGVSAGALAGLSYCAGHVGEAMRFLLQYADDPNFIGIQAALRTHEFINYSIMTDAAAAWDDSAKARFADPRRHFYAEATEMESGRPVFFEKKRDDAWNGQIIRASAAFPLMANPVEIEGKHYLDGGCSMQVPYAFALAMTKEPILVIRSNPREYRVRPSGGIYFRQVSRTYGKYEKFCEAMADNVARYNRECDALEKLEEEGRIKMICPERPMPFKRFTRDLGRMIRGYRQGFRQAKQEMDEIKNWLCGK